MTERPHILLCNGQRRAMHRKNNATYLFTEPELPLRDPVLGLPDLTRPVTVPSASQMRCVSFSDARRILVPLAVVSGIFVILWSGNDRFKRLNFMFECVQVAFVMQSRWKRGEDEAEGDGKERISFSIPFDAKLSSTYIIIVILGWFPPWMTRCHYGRCMLRECFVGDDDDVVLIIICYQSHMLLDI